MLIQRIKTYKALTKTFSGTTLTELLVVMIISGILFLLLFDGLNIITKYGHLLNKQLYQKSELLNAHQTLETILETTDSIRKNENELLLFNAGRNFGQLIVETPRIILYKEKEHVDTLFTNITNIRYHFISQGSFLLDSIYLYIVLKRDTIELNYALSPSLQNLNDNEPL